MDSYSHPHPFQTHHIPYYPNHYRPSWEVVSPQTMPDPINSAAPYGPWSYGGFGYPNPMEYGHHCWNHTSPPAFYSVRPPYYHLPPPSPLYYHGPYPYAEAYPPYFAPPHYSMEQPRYEYDKVMHEKHCCGCPHHVCRLKEDKGVKIEEYQPETLKKESGHLSPANNYSYRFGWVPSEYLKSKCGDKSSELEPKTWSGLHPSGVKNDSEIRMPHKLESKNRWIPLDVNDIKSLQQVGEKENKIQKNDEEKANQLPFPVFWVPAYHKPEEVVKEGKKDSDADSNVKEEQPPKLKIIPVNLLGSDDSGEKSEAVEDALGNGVFEKQAKKDIKSKNIVVELLEDTSLKSTERKPKEVCVGRIEQKENKFASYTSKRQPPSLQKSLKLPPVCLRVDPLPRRKSGNGTSRYSSPPGLKSKAGQTSVENKNTGNSPSEDNKILSSSKDHIQNEYEILEPRKEIKVVSDEHKEKLCEWESRFKDEEAAKAADEKHVKDREGLKNLSATEAAIIIQSIYRGFEVRKWEPLKKLKQIVKVREHAPEIRERIQNIECSTELQKDDKQSVLIGETIMSLLLQLDTIQGLHPSVRDLRKSVAKELVSLQEKLDSLSCQNVEAAEKPKAINLDEKQVVFCDTELNNGCTPPEHMGRVNEAEYQVKVKVKERFSADKETVADLMKESTQSLSETEAKKESLPTLALMNSKEEMTVEAVENAPNMIEEPGFGPEKFEQSVYVVDKKKDSDSELAAFEKALGESQMKDNYAVGKVVESLKIDHSPEPEVVHILEALPQGVLGRSPSSTDDNQEFVLSTDVDFVSQVVDDSPMTLLPFLNSESGELLSRSEDSILPDDNTDDLTKDVMAYQVPEGQKEDAYYMMQDFITSEMVNREHNDVVHVKTDALALPIVEAEHSEDTSEAPQDEKLSVCPSVKERRLEGPGGIHENIAQSDNVDIFSKPPSLTEIVLVPQVEPEQDIDVLVQKNKDNKSSRPMEETNKPHVDAEKPEGAEIEREEEKDDKLEVRAGKDVEVRLNEDVAREKIDLSSVADVKDSENSERSKKLIEENEKLREMVGKLVREGKHQLTAISDLNGRVKDLERKLKKKKKLRMRKHRAAPACIKQY